MTLAYGAAELQIPVLNCGKESVTQRRMRGRKGWLNFTLQATLKFQAFEADTPGMT